MCDGVFHRVYSFSQNVQTTGPVDESNIPQSGTRYITPTKYATYHLNLNELDELLLTTPTEILGQYTPSEVVLSLPNVNGEFVDFNVTTPRSWRKG